MVRNIILLLGVIQLCAQELSEQLPPDYIKSVTFGDENTYNGFPILNLGEVCQLRFDDLRAIDASYYYEITYADWNWMPSSLFKSEYLEGIDNLRIRDVENSYGTLQDYNHYRLQIPNNQTKLKLSGNYLLSVYDDDDLLVFSKRFLVSENIAPVGVSIHRSRDLNDIDYTQSVHFRVQTDQLYVRQPQEEIKTVVVQNYRWDTAIDHLTPTYIINNELRYEQNTESKFEGGNEYHFFDTKDLRSNGGNVSQVLRSSDLYETILFSNVVRAERPYTYAPDINGGFLIQTLQGYDPNTESDYTDVHFSLLSKPTLPPLRFFVVGSFNLHQPSEKHELFYDEYNGIYHTQFLIKQGIYNYKIISIDDQSNWNENNVSGSHWETENDYTVLVYQKKWGDLHFSLVGVGHGNSNNILN